MNITEIRAELEAEQAWRRSEILFLQNMSAKIDSVDAEKDQDKFRRAIILFLYAHFEGFCKFALLLYVNKINETGITCGEASYAIAAASLSDLFHALREPDGKCAEFRNTLPEDKKLHRFAKDREFLERAQDFARKTVQIPEKVVDVESNLRPVVLQKNLYRLGLPHDQFKDIENDIDKLLAFRNKIAHGDFLTGIDVKTYEALRDTTFKIMDEVTRDIMDALQKKYYLRT